MNEVKTVLFAGLIAAMILPFSAMDYPFDGLREAFAMQHEGNRHFHGVDLSTKRITNEATQTLRDSKATSFNEIPHFDRPTDTDIADTRPVAHRR